jgi:7-carboxy-7-deazaguanine synthase
MWDLTRLVQLLHGNNFAVAVETQGTLFRPWLLKAQMVVISPKGPGMGEKFEPAKFTNMVQQLVSNEQVFAIKVVVFSQQDIEFALDVGEIVRTIGIPPALEGMFFMSLGNPFPPVLTPELDFKENPVIAGEAPDYDNEPGVDHRVRLLRAMKCLVEDFVVDPRIQHWRFLPQLHVLLYSNEAER